MALNREQALALLKESQAKQYTGGRTKIDRTSERTYEVWWKLSHHIREEGCENPECADPRRKPDHPRYDKENNRPSRGVNIVAQVKEKWMCRDCFLGGWLA